MEGRRASGTVFHPWGADVCGRLTYDGAGHAWDGYHAWFGRFTVSLDEQSVVHRIEASLFPNWAAVEQTRLVALGEDELVLRSMPFPNGGEPVEFCTRWVRSRARETP